MCSLSLSRQFPQLVQEGDPSHGTKMVPHGAGEPMNKKGIWETFSISESYNSRLWDVIVLAVSVLPGKLNIWFRLCVVFKVVAFKSAEQTTHVTQNQRPTVLIFVRS